MALRVDCFAVERGMHLEREWSPDHVVVRNAAVAATDPGGSGPVRVVGYVSANDTDEQLLFDILALLGERSGHFDAREQGFGVVRAGDIGIVTIVLDAVTAGDLDSLGNSGAGPGQGWLDAVRSAIASVLALGLDFAWHTRYDRGGSISDGPDEFPTDRSAP
jgi:hypothetical protein